MKREKFNDKVTPNYNKNTTVHYVYQYTSWPVDGVWWCPGSNRPRFGLGEDHYHT